MNNNLINKKVLGIVGVSTLLGSSLIASEKISLLLLENEKTVFCVNKQKTDCLSDHLSLKIRDYSILGSSSSTIAVKFIQ